MEIENKKVQENFEKKVKNPFKILLVSRFNIDGIDYTLDFIKNKTFLEIIYVSKSEVHNEYIKRKNPQIQTVDFDYFDDLPNTYEIKPDRSDKKGSCLYIIDTDEKTTREEYNKYYWNTLGKQDFVIGLAVSLELSNYNHYDCEYLVILDEDLTKQENEKKVILQCWLQPFNEPEIDKLFLYNNATYPFIISRDKDYYKS